MRLAARLTLAVLAAAALPAGAEGPSLPLAPTGLARFTDHEWFRTAKVSPKGTYLAGAVARGGRQALVFIDLATRKPVGAFNPSGEEAVGRFEWASDERVVIELEDHDGTLEAPVSRGEIYAVNADGGSGRLIFGYRTGGGGTGTHIKKADHEWVVGQILDTLRDDDRYILVAGRNVRGEMGDGQRWVWKVDVITGAKEKIALGPLPNCAFLTDADGTLRLAYGRDERNRLRFFLREPEGWKELAHLPELPKGASPWGWVAADRALLVEAPLDGGWGLYQAPLEGGAPRLLARSRLAEFDHWLSDRVTGRVIAARSEPDLPEWSVVDPGHPFGKALAALLEEYAGWELGVTSRTLDDRLAVVRLSGDKAPAQFHLLDVATGKLEPLVSSRPWLGGAELAEVEAFHITASDGFKLHGYLTVPPAPAGSPPPLVLLPHGGPHGVRDGWGFDWQAQLLASQGFAVLQVNYRGSGGYGSAYEEAGYRRWGDRVVDDVLDAARWAIRKGKADGRRVCAMGGSFGAYAAMQAAIRAPDLVRCAVGIAGVYDLTLMGRSDDLSWSRLGRGYVKTVLGEDEAQLRAFSPAHNAAALRAPVLLAHGGRDERAPIAHAKRLRDALEEAGRQPEWIVESSEGHGFFDEAARLRLYEKVVAFLRRNTAPPLAAPAAPGGPASVPAPAAPAAAPAASAN